MCDFFFFVNKLINTERIISILIYRDSGDEYEFMWPSLIRSNFGHNQMLSYRIGVADGGGVARAIKKIACELSFLLEHIIQSGD